MRTKGIIICALVCGAMLISGCSNPYNRAKEVKDEFGKSAYVVSENHAGETPELVTAQKIKKNDSEVYRVSIHNLNDGSMETLDCSFKPVEVLKNAEGYLIISEYVNNNTPKRKNYCVETISQNGESTVVWLDEDDENVSPTAYVVDKNAKQIILTGFSTINEDAKEYYVKIDFEGKKVAEDTKTLALKPTRKAMYLWVCSNCGVTCNTPSNGWPYTSARCRIKPDGTYMAHNFSNHGRVD